MLEIIALIFLSTQIGQKAEQKGLPKTRWILYTIGAWLVFEFFGIVFAVMLFGTNNLFAAYSIGIMSAVGGFLFVRYRLDQTPGPINHDDIDNIGQ